MLEKEHDDYDKASMQGHAFFLYSSEEERLGMVAEYFKQGLAKNELCIFVTPEPLEAVIKSFGAVGFNAKKAVEDKSLRIFEMEPTYLPDGHFVADYMLDNVKNFMQAAQSQGYSGLRTAGEMRWLTEHLEATQEAITYEQLVNTLDTPDSNFVGLCLYPLQDTSSEKALGISHTHPSVIYNKRAHLNPHYEAA